ncbi:outer membrane lipoprotein carrier protein LolA [Stigmatella sp. ncwal1]|uniref:Outer membrane lipoprotein carrier protein LolA n=1 Tax=Stigmatella ashevillensis TaxID=2995309 RepID=A0ABT5DKA7_9BACT|nr:outer membrane lipoprotein carrier protein LolA [Stigmatella ashevillena]MDC0714053.1 outer membrane lipoprotein carrier protein LolA [Stigmatella ashevillena]
MLIETLLVSLLSAQAAPPAPVAPKPTPAVEVSKPAATAKGSVAPEVKTLVERMQSFYEKTEDFQSGFKQDYKYKTFRRTQTSTGTVTYKKPGLMRWEYEKPSPRTFVLAGSKVYAYDPGAQSLTVGNVDTNTLSASVTFLFGQGCLADEFNITKGTCADCKGTLLVLDPAQADPRFKQVRLEVDSKTAQVLKSTVIDPDGSENTIAFLDLKTNVGISKDSFKLDPPEGTRIDDFTKQGK